MHDAATKMTTRRLDNYDDTTRRNTTMHNDDATRREATRQEATRHDATSTMTMRRCDNDGDDYDNDAR